MIENTAIEQLLPWGKPAAWCSTIMFITVFFCIFSNCSYISPLCSILPSFPSQELSMARVRMGGKGQVFGFHCLVAVFLGNREPYISCEFCIIYMFVWHNLHHRVPLSEFWFSSLSSPLEELLQGQIDTLEKKMRDPARWTPHPIFLSTT